MKDIIFSIIVPLYNAEKTIKKCLQSLQSQTYHEIEIILVNDGSEDNTLNIISDLIELDSRVIVINKPNGGVSSARNLGLFRSSGDYLLFVDSDDWVDNTLISDYHKKIVEYDYPDMVCQKLLDNRVIDVQKTGLFANKDLVFGVIELERTNSIGYLHNKCFKGSKVREINVTFPLGINYSEDLIFVINFTTHINSLFIDDVVNYHYMDTPDSLSKRKVRFSEMESRLFIFNEIYNKLLDNYSESPEKKVLSKLITMRMLNNEITKIFSMINDFNLYKFDRIEFEINKIKNNKSYDDDFFLSRSAKLKLALILLHPIISIPLFRLLIILNKINHIAVGVFSRKG